MKSTWKVMILTVLSISFLSGCNVEKREALNPENEVNFRPIRYERNTINKNESNNDFKNHENRQLFNDETPEEMSR